MAKAAKRKTQKSRGKRSTKRGRSAGTRAAKSSRRTMARAAPSMNGLAQFPLSGRYYGAMTSADAGKYELDLRIDIDRRYANSRVLNRVSGDLHQVFSFEPEGAPPSTWRVYRESWIVDEPEITWDDGRVEVTGAVRSWNGNSIERTIAVQIPWGEASAGPARVAITRPDGEDVFRCEWRSHNFRDAELEIDICKSVNAEPLIPLYDTHAHQTRPDDLAQRVLTIEEAYQEAGLGLALHTDHAVIDDSHEDFESWTSAELHEAMVDHFERISDQQQWQLWGMLAGQFEESGVGGIMFDAAAEFGGAGVAPERQGFAVFRNHSWFKDLVPGAPANQKQAWAARHFLYTWVHEAGHAFNFLHSWNKSRPDSLSWMNYDWRYDSRNGTGKFWSRFEFRFDEEELLHLRHGNRAAVIMGGDPWASGGHLESEDGDLAEIAVVDGAPPLELLLRAPDRFEFLEPVTLELRLRNLRKDIPLEVDGRLHPEYGTVAVYVRDPNGKVTRFDPLLCKLAEADAVTLQPSDRKNPGPDRLSVSLPISFGGHGFYFSHPGEYVVRAVYQGLDGSFIPSNFCRISIGYPTSPDEERLAADFFSPQVGLNIYLGGSRSPRLKGGLDVLQKIVARYASERKGARAAAIVASALKRPFFRLKNGKLEKSAKAEPEQSLRVTEEAANVFAQGNEKWKNLPYRRVVEQRAESWQALGEKAKAKEEIQAMASVLAARGVNDSVLKAIEAKV